MSNVEMPQSSMCSFVDEMIRSLVGIQILSLDCTHFTHCVTLGWDRT